MKLGNTLEAKLTRTFDTIYIEKEAQDYELTKKIISQFTKSQLISINSYQEIFNRNRQDFRQQKLSPKLILGIKKDSYLYAGSSFTPSFNQPYFFYNAMALNCLYDCSYCYLQGMFNSANLVIFVNEQDFYQATLDKLAELGSLYLSISYDTDLLAIEHLTGFCAKWIELCQQNPNLLVESRTKSVNFNSIKELEPTDNFILSWTLSPKTVSEKIEVNTPSLISKIKAIKNAQARGWKVRICFDPLLVQKNWMNEYQDLIAKIKVELDVDLIRDFSIGSFRMNDSFYKKIKKSRPNDALFAYPYEKINGIISYSAEQDKKLKNTVCQLLIDNGVPSTKIYL